MLSKTVELPAWHIEEMIRSGEMKVQDYITDIASTIGSVEDDVHSYITVLEEQALESAKDLDRSVKQGVGRRRLYGVAVAVKDNISTEGIKTTCASRILENYVPPYDATVVERLKREGGVIIGKANMDEFAMGTSTEFSCFGPTRNPWSRDRVPGGSSGGSAAAVASGEATIALGSDTGGSVRCPAAFCSVVGLKPTYGLVSRYGLVSYANSLEQIGPIARDVKDCALLLDCIAGHDARDSTSVQKKPVGFTKLLGQGVKGLRMGVPPEFLGPGTEKAVEKHVRRAADALEAEGIRREDVSFRSLDYGLAAYYVIATSEASSNLARFDGIRYGLRVSDASRDWVRVFSENRKRGFGAEVKRRIIMGTYALSAGYYDQYYLKAQRIRTLVGKDFEEAFKKVDFIVTPTMPILPFKIGEKIQDPLKMYMCDVDTVPANLAGVPAISIPAGFHNNLPIGVQLIAPAFREDILFKVGYALEKLLKVGRRIAG